MLLLIWSYLAFFESWCRSRQPFSHFLTQQFFIVSNYFYYQVINHCWVYLFSPIPNTDAIRISRISNPSDGHYSVSLYLDTPRILSWRACWINRQSDQRSKLGYWEEHYSRIHDLTVLRIKQAVVLQVPSLDSHELISDLGSLYSP